MNSFINTNGFHCVYYWGNEVQLPDAADKVEVVRYAESELIRICKKSQYRTSLIHNSDDAVTSKPTALAAPTYHLTSETHDAGNERANDNRVIHKPTEQTHHPATEVHNIASETASPSRESGDIDRTDEAIIAYKGPD